VFAQPVLAVSCLDDLRSDADASRDRGAGSEIQQVGVPMQIPREVQHLKRTEKHSEGERGEGQVEA